MLQDRECIDRRFGFINPNGSVSKWIIRIATRQPGPELLQSSFNYLSAAGRTANASILDDSMFIESFPICVIRGGIASGFPVRVGIGRDRNPSLLARAVR